MDCREWDRFRKVNCREAALVQPNFAHCFGMVWGLLPFPFPHSLNWMVTADKKGNKKLYFVEPNTYSVFKPRKSDKNIYFLLV